MRKVKEFVKLSLKLLNKIHIVLLAIGIVSVFFSGCVVRNTKIRPITKFERKELPTEIPGPLFLTMYVDTMTTISMWGYSFVDSGNNVVTFYWPDANLAFSKFVPELYSDTTLTIPIVIKITVDDYGKKIKGILKEYPNQIITLKLYDVFKCVRGTPDNFLSVDFFAWDYYNDNHNYIYHNQPLQYNHL